MWIFTYRMKIWVGLSCNRSPNVALSHADKIVLHGKRLGSSSQDNKGPWELGPTAFLHPLDVRMTHLHIQPLKTLGPTSFFPSNGCHVLCGWSRETTSTSYPILWPSNAREVRARFLPQERGEVDVSNRWQVKKNTPTCPHHTILFITLGLRNGPSRRNKKKKKLFIQKVYKKYKIIINSAIHSTVAHPKNISFYICR